VLLDAAAGLQYPLGLAATETDLWVGDWATGTVGELLVVEAGAGKLTAIDPAAAGVPSGTIGSTSRRVAVVLRALANRTVPSGARPSVVAGAVSASPEGATATATRTVSVPGATPPGLGSTSWKTMVRSAVRSPVGRQTPTPTPTRGCTST
jgi:hypothetical protein